MIHPSVVFLGDSAAATPWVGMAKKLARECYANRIAHKVYRIGTDVQIRIENIFPALENFGGVCKAWIEAGASGGFYYQFITTGEEVSTYTSSGFTIFKGSAVSVRFPKTTSLIGLKVIATGSTLEEIPTDPPTPPIESTQLISKVKNIAQAQLIPEPVYYGFAGSVYDTEYAQLAYSWASVPGRVYNAGVYMLAPAFSPSDKFYDLAPSVISGNDAESRMPDADWPHDACIVTVQSTEFGNRQFIVMVDANSTFYCWPTSYDNSATEYLYPEDSPYIPQAIKTNVADEQVISVVPPFPAWVYVPTDQRRDTDYPLAVNSGEPRYVWRFHPNGTKAVGIVLKREEFLDAAIWGRVPTDQTYIPYEEVDTGFELGIDTTLRPATAVLDYQGPLKSDWPGYVEFSLDIVITGSNRENFTFDLTLTRSQAASATRYPIAAGYISPIKGGWPARGLAVSPGDLVVMDVKSYIDVRAQLWIDRECGYKGHTSDKVRQTWLTVTNEETSTQLTAFLAKDQPTDFRSQQYYLDTTDLYVMYGVLKHIDLSTLSFVYQVRRKKYDVDATSYATVTGHTVNVNYNDFKVRQRWLQEEVGVRYYVYGKKVQEFTEGTSLSTWDTVDATTLSEGLIQFSPLTTGTKWPYSRSIVGGNSVAERHWLLQHIGYAPLSGFWGRFPYFNYVDLNEPTGIVQSDNIEDMLLQYCAPLTNNSGVTKDAYSVPGVVNTGDGTIDGSYSSMETDFSYTLSSGCSTVDNTYVADILVPWLDEVYQEFLGRCTLTPKANLYSYAYGTSSDTPPSVSWVTFYEHPSTRSWWGIYRVYADQDNLTFASSFSGYVDCNNCAIFPTLEEIEAYILTLPIGTSFSTTSPHYNFIPIPRMARDCSFIWSTEEFYRTDLNNNLLNHPNLRVYDYPIGAEWMMREWNQAIELDANFSLAVSPEGYYAGAACVPASINAVPDTSLFATYVYDSSAAVYYDLPNEPHFNTWPYNYAHSQTVDVPLQHVTIADGTFSYNNAPIAADYTFLPIDIISHADITGSTSHAILYERVYKKELSIPNPVVSISVNNFVYTPKQTITYETGTKVKNLFDSTPTFYEPRYNGSMFFSK